MSNSINRFFEKIILENHDKAHNSTKNLSYKNNIFYSYNEPIGRKIDDLIIIHPKTASTGEFFSMTTSKHIGYLKKFCDNNKIDNYYRN